MKRPFMTDFDNSLVPLAERLILFLNNEKGKNLKIENLTTYNFQEFIGQTFFLQTVKTLREFHQSPYFKEIKPIEGAVELLTEIKKDRPIQVNTTRPKIIRQSTEYQIASLFQGLIDQTHFAKNLDMCFNGARKTKAQICEEFNAIAILEDQLADAIDCAKKGVKVFLMNTYWNQTPIEYPGIQRVYNLFEVQKYLPALVRA